MPVAVIAGRTPGSAKWRNLDAPPMTRHWHVVTEAGCSLSYKCTDLTFDGKVPAKIQDGLRSATAIVKKVCLSPRDFAGAFRGLLD
jgi:hypothetical protein